METGLKPCVYHCSDHVDELWLFCHPWLRVVRLLLHVHWLLSINTEGTIYYHVCFSIDHCDLVLRAIRDVLNFKISSPLATAAQETASLILTYCGDHPPYPSLFCTFSEKFLTELGLCFSDKKSFKHEKEVMWGNYHMHRSSTAFQHMWIQFVEQAIHQTPSSFYQHVTHQVFKSLIEIKYPVSESTGTEASPHLTGEENALRYVAGHVIFLKLR